MSDLTVNLSSDLTIKPSQIQNYTHFSYGLKPKQSPIIPKNLKKNIFQPFRFHFFSSLESNGKLPQ